MTTQEKFAVWDSTQPTLAEIEAYLERMRGDTPLKLVYRTSDGDIVNNHYISRFRAEFLGILLPESNKLVRMKTLDTKLFLAIPNREDVSVVRNGMRKYMAKLTTNINYIDAKGIRIPIRIANQGDMEKLNAHLQEFEKTLSVLKYYGINVFDRVKLQHLAWSNSGLFCHDMLTSKVVPIWEYIREVGDMLIFSDYGPFRVKSR
ncbi:MAG: hypothetical protein IJ778_02340 [Alphaproteobacteria bacterium]|nr:hypothetical protein [Alphaproteobacteria bacterium]